MVYHSFIFITLQLLLNLITSIDNSETECTRHRRPWHMLSDDDRMHFVLGFQQLRNNGILSSFCETHHLEGVAFQNIHKTSEFFFWHSYFVWEVENQFRNLGDDYACFSMPYWDITNDAAYLDDDINFEYIPILNSMLGANGNIDNNNCINDDLWNINKYKTEFLCVDDEISPNCCLKRQINYNGEIEIGSAGIANVTEITNSMKYKRFRVFQDIISLYHGKIHKFFAMTNESHMYSNNAAEDPLFVLLHSFIDYIRFMRSDCLNYDKIDISELDEYIPFVFDSYQDLNVGESVNIKPTLDTPMEFAFICDNPLAVCNNNDITPRKMFDPSLWDISYELGTFWSNNYELQSFCDNKLNDTWFYNEQLMNKQQIVNGITNGGNKYNYSLFMALIYVVIGLVIIVFFVHIVIKQYSFYEKKNYEMMRKLIDNNGSTIGYNYGTV